MKRDGNGNKNKISDDGMSKKQEAEIFFKEIGLEKERGRNRLRSYNSDGATDLNYKTHFRNNTKL